MTAINSVDELADVIRHPNDGVIGAVSAAYRVLEKCVVIPRSELPSVKRATHDENTYYTDRENVVFTSVENARMWVMRDVAVWQFLEYEASILAAQEAEKDAARDKRRDELASEFTAVNSYSGQLPYTQNLINRIIELEAAK